MSTAKCIWFLYRILHVIPISQRTMILTELLGSTRFYSYFFHWSYNVRMVFYYLYFFQMYHSLGGKGKQGSIDGLVEALTGMDDTSMDNFSSMRQRKAPNQNT